MQYRVIGIDPGINVVGWSVLECKDNKKILIDLGTISPKNKNIPDRLFEIYSQISDIVTKYNPTQAAVEKIFLNKNPRSTLTLENARGAISLTFAILKIPIFEYSACKIKEIIVGHGHAQKKQIQYIVNNIFQIKDSNLKDDAYDACAIALCHLYCSKLQIF